MKETKLFVDSLNDSRNHLHSFDESETNFLELFSPVPKQCRLELNNKLHPKKSLYDRKN